MGTDGGEGSERRVVLRDEDDRADRRHLEAWVDGEGRLHVDGQDLGPATAIVSDDGEYEWFTTYAAVDVPRLTELLGGLDGEAVIELLQRSFTGPRSYDLERLLRESDIPYERTIW